MMRYGSSQTEETSCPRQAICRQPIGGKPLITAIRAMRLDSGFCLIRIDTDAGISGYGECGSLDGDYVRAAIDLHALGGGRLKHLKLIGKDPLDIAVHHHNLFYAYPQRPAEVQVLSGIDMALWDSAGKLLNQPVHKLLGGKFRDDIALNPHCPHFDSTDPGAVDLGACGDPQGRSARLLRLQGRYPLRASISTCRNMCRAFPPATCARSAAPMSSPASIWAKRLTSSSTAIAS